MTEFKHALAIGILAIVATPGCGDKQNPLGDYQAPGSTAGAPGTGGTAGGGGSGGGGTSGTSGVSYADVIAPMMAASCALSGCHAGASPTVGIGLDTYANVSTHASAANSAIQAGIMPIPPGANLTATDKQNFQSWVSAGAPNN
jgi:hypothetical protein